ncbi:MAG: GLPGLI family protein [Leadbetterella sp.]
MSQILAQTNFTIKNNFIMKIKLSVILFLLYAQVFGQNKTINGIMKYKILMPKKDGNSITYGTLFLNNQSSLSTPDQDVNTFINGKPNKIFDHSKNRYYQYKDHTAKTIYSTQGSKDVLKDTLLPVGWKLIGETKKIGSFTCKKAKGKISGREYEVWYTPQIPISTGPWKFYGLPGLILEAKEIDGSIEFEFISLTLNDKSFETPTLPEIRPNQKLWNKKEYLVYYKKVYSVPQERIYTKDGVEMFTKVSVSGIDIWD